MGAVNLWFLVSGSGRSSCCTEGCFLLTVVVEASEVGGISLGLVGMAFWDCGESGE